MFVVRVTTKTSIDTFVELAEILRAPEATDVKPVTTAQQIMSEAVSGIDGVNFRRFPKSQALDIGLRLLSAHLSRPVINLTTLITHFLAYDERCEDANALEHSDVIRMNLRDLLRNQFVPYVHPMPLNTRTYSRR
jgi:hypothetical protein